MVEERARRTSLAFQERPWGAAAPRLADHLRLMGGGRGPLTVDVYVCRPDLSTHDRQATMKYLAWRHGGTGRLPIFALTVLLCLVLGRGLFTDGNHYAWWILVPVGLAWLLDSILTSMHARPAREGLSATHHTTLTAHPGRKRLLSEDTPAHYDDEATAQAFTTLDTVLALHNDGLVDLPEWEAAHWAAWDHLDLSPQSRPACINALNARLDDLIVAASQRAR